MLSQLMVQNAQAIKAKATDSERSLCDINERKFLSTLELANEKI